MPLIMDRSDVHTPLAGIATALRTAKHDHVFVCACDMPFVAPDLVRFLAERAVGHAAAVPRRNARPEATCAVWSARAADDIDAALAVGERAVYRVLDTLDVVWIDEPVWKAIDPTGASFVNINTPEDLARL
jgi:molybdopterin-guanine dinucleotide biosynthesis protein A